MKTLFQNFVEAGATVKQVPNGIRVDLGSHTFLFSDKEEVVSDIVGICNVKTIPLALKEALVVVTTKPRWDNSMRCLTTREVLCFGRIPLEWEEMASYKVYC